MRILFAILIFAGLFSSCSKSPKCWGNDRNKGIINTSILINCFPTTYQDNFIITTDSAYQKIFSDTLTGQTVCNLPTIDFSTYSLLGQRASGQCEIKFIREATRIDSEKKYHYKVTAKSCGLCKKEAFGDNWVTVPKVPSGWTVTFEIDEK